MHAIGVDAIKLIYADQAHSGRQPVPVMQPEVMRAIIEEAHRLGLKAYVHAPGMRYAKEVLRAGADGLVHSVTDAPLDDEFIMLMKKNGATYTTTLSLYTAVSDVAAWTRRLAAMDTRGRDPERCLREVSIARSGEGLPRRRRYLSARQPSACQGQRATRRRCGNSRAGRHGHRRARSASWRIEPDGAGSSRRGRVDDSRSACRSHDQPCAGHWPRSTSKGRSSAASSPISSFLTPTLSPTFTTSARFISSSRAEPRITRPVDRKEDGSASACTLCRIYTCITAS